MLGKYFKENYLWTIELDREVEYNFVNLRIYSFLRSPLVLSLCHFRRSGVETLTCRIRSWAWYLYFPRLWIRRRLAPLEQQGITLVLEKE